MFSCYKNSSKEPQLRYLVNFVCKINIVIPFFGIITITFLTNIICLKTLDKFRIIELTLSILTSMWFLLPLLRIMA